MTARNIGYWITTVLLAFAFIPAGIFYFAGAKEPLEGLKELGYPAYLLMILGFWKIGGGIVVLLPRTPLLKEWAYAGITFNLTGAVASHVFAGDPPAKSIAPLVILGIAVASWALRPESRRLPSAKPSA
jgi:uncharacterized membrane protein YphA (DoxX/SURF4 family)